MSFMEMWIHFPADNAHGQTENSTKTWFKDHVIIVQIGQQYFWFKVLPHDFLKT